MSKSPEDERKVIPLFERRDWQSALWRVLLAYGWPPDKAAQVVMFAEFLTGLRSRNEES